MAQIEVEPLLVRGKHEDGYEVEIDIGLMLASDPAIRTTFQRGVQQLLDKGFPGNYSLSVAFILSEQFADDGDPAVVIFPKTHLDTSLDQFILEPEESG